MISKATIGGGIVALILFIIQIIALATPNWFILELSGKTTLEIGLFAVCVPEKECVTYGRYMFKDDGPSFSYIAFVGLNILGCFFNFVSMVICFGQAIDHKPERPYIQRMAAMWFFSGGFIIAGIIWIYVSLARFDLLTAESSLSLYPGYSFYFGCISGLFHIMGAIAMTVIASRLPVPPVMAAGVVTTTGPQVLVMQTDSRGYPPVSQPQSITTNGYPTNASYGLPQNHPSYGYDQP